MTRPAWRTWLRAVVLQLLAAWPAAAAEDVSFLPLWSHQAQFAGVYAALEKGIYQKHGLNVDLLRGGPAFPPAEALASGRARYAMLWLSEALKLRGRGVKVVNLAQVSQRSALVLVARRSARIAAPRDLNGKRVSLWTEFSTQPVAFMRKHGVKAEVVPQSYTVNLFLRGGVDACSAMIYNEYHTLLNSGLDAADLTVFRFDEHGLNFPEDGVYALEAAYRARPDEACRLARATIEGWVYALSHREETLGIVLRRMREANIPASPAHQRWMLDRMAELVLPVGKGRVGELKRSDFDLVARELKARGLVSGAPAWGSFAVDCGGR